MQAFPPPHLGHGGLLGLPLFDKVRPMRGLQAPGGRRAARAPNCPPLGARAAAVQTEPPRPCVPRPAPQVMRLHQQEPTPTSSADEADLVKKAVLKSPL